MKKVILTVSVILVLLLAAIIIVPIAFKGPLLKKVKTTINNQVNAKVEFEDFNLSLWRSFPNVMIELQGLTVVGTGDFANDTLISMQSLATDISLSDLFKGEDFTIQSLRLKEAQVNLLASQTGQVNWDIVKPRDQPEAIDESGESMGISLQDIEVRDLSLIYKDEASAMVVALMHANLDASGRMEGTITHFDLDAEVGEFKFEYDSTAYIANTVLKVKSQLMADYDKMNFEFGESTLHLNKLPLDLSGKFEMPSDSMYFDLKFKQPQSDFATLLAMVPQSYQSYLEDIKTTGEAGFEGMVKGWYYEEDMPEIDLRLFVKNASLNYAGSPEKIEQISMDGQISKPQGDFDLLTVKISKAHAQIRENPIDARLTITTPMSDPQFDAYFNGKIDFTRLAEIIPMDSLELKGFMDGNLAIKGRMSAIEKEDYQKISSSGAVNFKDFSIKTPQINQTVEISSGSLKLDNTAITLSSLSAKTGQSDFQLKGKLSNYLPYFLMDKTLKGEFSLNSNYLNFNELANLMAEDTVATASSDSVIAFQVPANLDLAFNSKINRATFDRMDIRNIVGAIVVKDRMLVLKQLNMDMLEGQLTVDGSYKSNDANQPLFDFNMNITSIQIPAAYQSFGLMQQYMPIAARSQGDISTQVKFKGQFDEKLDIITSSLDGNGLFNTQNLQIVNSPTFDQIKNFIKKEKLKNVRVDDFTAHFSLNKGNVEMKPFKTKIADQDVAISGKLSVTQILDMKMDFKVNREDMSTDINNALGFLPGSKNISLIPVTVNITGDLTNPKVALDLSQAKKEIQEEVKKSTKEELDKSVKKIGDQLKKLFN
ncbi:AsmA family protein [Sunxiuqinia sp. sy24]|uniref:AsmA family protein n=1 Tax=Sunxiuqinia sp. sy24 TaxID=3461495 RepID=UPI0040451D9F